MDTLNVTAKKTLPSLDELLKNLTLARTEGKIGLYMVKHKFRSKSGNYALILPDNKNQEFLGRLCDALESFFECSCRAFDPIEKEAGCYEYIDFKEVEEQWETIKRLISKDEYRKNYVDGDIAETNLSVCVLGISDREAYKNCLYYICRMQTPQRKLEKYKHALFHANGELEEIDQKKLWFWDSGVDVVIREQEGNKALFVLNERNFMKMFAYEGHLQKIATDNIEAIENWKFISNPDFITEKIGQKNVYRRLAKIFLDNEYVNEIMQTDAVTLKKNLLQHGGDYFNESDFVEGKLCITRNNLDKVMRMLAKGYKYNFFTNRAVEQ